jgi:hypothetical protein
MLRVTNPVLEGSSPPVVCLRVLAEDLQVAVAKTGSVSPSEGLPRSDRPARGRVCTLGRTRPAAARRAFRGALPGFYRHRRECFRDGIPDYSGGLWRGFSTDLTHWTCCGGSTWVCRPGAAFFATRGYDFHGHDGELHFVLFIDGLEGRVYTDSYLPYGQCRACWPPGCVAPCKGSGR